MNNYEDWSQLVAKNLKGEADLIAAIEKDELDDTAAKDAFVRAVLEPFLPESYAIGSGRVVDAQGNYSDHLDIIIYNRDFPRIGIRGTHSVYLLESVLAAIVVKSKLIRKTFFDALNSCASLAKLDPNIDKSVLRKLANRNGMALDQDNNFVHSDPLRTARFKMIGRPPVFVYAFSGFKTSFRQLEENCNLWLEYRQREEKLVEMKSLPAVIATQGCFSWRNAAPLALNNRHLMGIGTDSAPVRLIVLHLLHLLNRRLSIQTDAYGLKPNLSTYLSQFTAPHFETGVGNLTEKPDSQAAQKTVEKTETTAAAVTQAAAAAAAAAEVGKAPADETPAATSTPPILAAVPSKPPLDISLDAEEEEDDYISTTSFGARDTIVASAESLANGEPKSNGTDHSANGAAESIDREDSEARKNSTNAFIARVKKQMSSPEPFPEFQPETEPQADPFSSTIPQ